MEQRFYNLPLDDLLADLQENKFFVGIETYQNILKILNEIDFSLHYHELGEILCPLFATSHREQELFYKIFEKYFPKEEQKIENKFLGKIETNYEDLDEKLKPKALPKRKWIIAIAGFLILVSVGFSYWKYSQKAEKIGEKIAQTNDTIAQHAQQQTILEQKNDSLKEDLNNIKRQEHENNFSNTIENKPVKDETNENKPEEIKETRQKIETEIVVNIEEMQRLEREKFDSETQILLQQNEKKQQRKRLIFFVTLISLAVIFSAYELYKYLRRRLIANSRKGKKPPLVWSIYLHEQEINIDKGMYSLANKMRQRIETDTEELNLNETVKASTENAGIILPQFTFNTRPVEYLMLIDWSSHRNHQAQLFEHLYRTFVSNNVYVERYFYDADPRLLWNEHFGDGISIQKLLQEYPDHYLLMFGNAHVLLNPFTEKLMPVFAFFEEWKSRALLTSVPSQQWGMQELELAKLFPVLLPSNMQGLMALIEHLGIKDTSGTDLKLWKFGIETPEFSIFIEPTQPAVPQLKRHFEPEFLTWIAICAIYPELYWDLTLYLGKKLNEYLNLLPENKDRKLNLLQQQSIEKLNRLEWFTEGKIPDAARLELISDTEILPENIKKIAAAAIIEVLKKNLKDKEKEKERADKTEPTEDFENTHAHNHFLMNIVINELLLKPEKKERKKLLSRLSELSDSTRIQDFVQLEYLEKQNKNLLNLVMPKQFNRYFYQKGKSYLGLKKSIRFSLYFLVLLLAFFVTKPPKMQTYDTVELIVHGPADTNDIILKNTGKLMLSFKNGDGISAQNFTTNEYGQVFWRIGRGLADSLTAQLTDTVWQARKTVAFTSKFYLEATKTTLLQGIIAEIENNMVKIQGGKFIMGSKITDDEQPEHEVSISSFSMSKFEVSNEQFAAFLNDYGSDKEYSAQTMIKEYIWGVKKNGNIWQAQSGYEKHPVVYVTWYGANKFCNWLNNSPHTKFKKYRLPSEAQWEYAAGGGANKRTKYAGTNNKNDLGTYAWYDKNSYYLGSSHKDYGTHKRGTKTKNTLGLHDMSGNVWEWCLDWYDSGYYENSPPKDPVNSTKASARVFRGGGWYYSAINCRVANRISYNPTYRISNLGFRLVLLP